MTNPNRNRSGFLMLTLTLVLVSSAIPLSTANFFDSILNGACASFVAGLNTGKCYDEFLENYKEFKDKDQEVPEYVACCGISIMQSCLEDVVQEKCGGETKGIAKSLVGTFVKTSNELAGKPLQCDWDAWYYDRKSPVCWPIWAQAIGGIGVLILLLGCAGCCCCSLCCSRRRRQARTTYSPVKPRA